MIRLVTAWLLVLALFAGCTTPMIPAPAPMQRFCKPDENPVINHCRNFSADQTSGGTVRGNHDQNLQ